MDIRKRETKIWAGLVLLVMAALSIWLFRVFRANPTGEPSVEPKVDPPAAFVSVINMVDAPADVQAAAQALKSSRVGYAMMKPDKTYLIISAGDGGPGLAVDRAETQPADATPTFIDIFLNSDPGGERLLIATTPLTSHAEYQFNLDGQYAVIPTLHNMHKLPLVYLNESTGFSVVVPADSQLIEGQTMRVEGYARVFEAAFMARVTTEKGRLLGEAPVMAAAGAPNWGSFVAEFTFDTAGLPESGILYLVLTEEMTGAEVVIPVSYRKPAQLG